MHLIRLDYTVSRFFFRDHFYYEAAVLVVCILFADESSRNPKGRKKPLHCLSTEDKIQGSVFEESRPGVSSVGSAHCLLLQSWEHFLCPGAKGGSPFSQTVTLRSSQLWRREEGGAYSYSCPCHAPCGGVIADGRCRRKVRWVSEIERDFASRSCRLFFFIFSMRFRSSRRGSGK